MRTRRVLLRAFIELEMVSLRRTAPLPPTIRCRNYDYERDVSSYLNDSESGQASHCLHIYHFPSIPQAYSPASSVGTAVHLCTPARYHPCKKTEAPASYGRKNILRKGFQRGGEEKRVAFPRLLDRSAPDEPDRGSSRNSWFQA